MGLLIVGEDLAAKLRLLSEVEQQADFNRSGFEVVQQLRFVGGAEADTGFHFDDHTICDNQVGEVDANVLLLEIDL